MASGSPTSNFMPLQPCNAKSDLSASRYSSWWAMRRGASLRTRSGANPAFRSDRPPRKCFFSLTRITSPARPVTTYKERVHPRSAARAALDLTGAEDAAATLARNHRISHRDRSRAAKQPPGRVRPRPHCAARSCRPWPAATCANRTGHPPRR